MPYITQGRRKVLDQYLRSILRMLGTYENEDLQVGELNYIITRIVHKWISKKGISYQNLNTAIGVLDCAKMELYRMIAAPYEDIKKKENGCISELDRIPDDETQAI